MSTQPTLDELEILWKRLNRQGVYYDKPMKYTEFRQSLADYIQRAVKEAEKEQLKRTNGVAGALGRFAEQSAKMPHKYWYIGLDKKGKPVMFPEEKGLPLQQAIQTTVDSIKSQLSTIKVPLVGSSGRSAAHQRKEKT